MNISGKYLKVWKAEHKGTYTRVDLGDSRKNKEGTYDKFTWFGCMLVGEANKLNVEEGDTLEITSGQIYMEKYNDKWSPRITVFDGNVTKKDKKADDDFSFGDFDDVPFK